MARVAKNLALDPTLPKVEIILDGHKFHLVFTFAALATAEAKLRQAGISVNLLHCLDLSNMDAERVVPLLYAALLSHQPAITVEVVTKLVTLRNLGNIFEGIANAYAQSLAEPSATDAVSDPIQPEK